MQHCSYASISGGSKIELLGEGGGGSRGLSTSFLADKKNKNAFDNNLIFVLKFILFLAHSPVTVVRDASGSTRVS